MIYNSNDIQNILPHRYPFLLVDTIEEIIDETCIIGKKNVMHFMGHFPQKHVMPGVLIVEALAQTGAVLLLSKEENKGKIAVLAGVNKMRFKRQVIPGDTLTLKVELTRMKAGIGFASATAFVGDEVAAKGEIMFAIDK